MTEKRFTKCDTKIRDNGEEMTQAEVRDMLNSLNDENKELRIQYNFIREHSNEFHRRAIENADRVGKLERENEQLRDFIRKEFPKSYKHILEGLE